MSQAGAGAPSASVLPIIACAVFVAGGLLAGKVYVDRELAKRPPIVVIDEPALVRAVGGSQADPRDLEEVYRSIDTASKQLTAGGYVVLRRGAVYETSPAIEVRP